MLTAPVWVPLYFAGVGAVKVWKALQRRKPKQQEMEVLTPVWTPVSDLERTVYAAMILAGRPVSNAELARFMNVSPGEASRRVKALDGVLRKERVGREVRISLPHYH
jgi:hypothetical protein